MCVQGVFYPRLNLYMEERQASESCSTFVALRFLSCLARSYKTRSLPRCGDVKISSAKTGRARALVNARRKGERAIYRRGVRASGIIIETPRRYSFRVERESASFSSPPGLAVARNGHPTRNQ